MSQVHPFDQDGSDALADRSPVQSHDQIDGQYDILVVGAGPAGLSAARTAARLGFRTLVLERLPGPGGLGHPCHAVIHPLPGIITGRPLMGGLFFPQVDLWIGPSLITMPEAVERCFSPAGYEYQTLCDSGNNRFSAVVDKSGVLRLMAEQAAGAGADFLFNTQVTGLLQEDGQVAGVQTTSGEVRASLVMAADGAMSPLSEQAGCFDGQSAPERYMLVVTLELDAPGVGAADTGHIVTLGRSCGFSQEGYVSVLTPRPGRAEVTFTNLIDELGCATTEGAAAYLDSYARDPRINRLLAGAQIISQSSHVLPLRSSPTSIVQDGFMALGDAVTPAGRLGILESIYLGRQAALVAAEALDTGSVAAANLEAYDQLYRSVILPGLQAELRTTLALLEMDDEELDRLSEVLNGLHLSIPFVGHKPLVEWDTVDWLLRQLPLTEGDCGLLQRVMSIFAGAPALAGSAEEMRLPCQSSVPTA